MTIKDFIKEAFEPGPTVADMARACETASKREARFQFVKSHILNKLRDTDNTYSDFSLDTYIQHYVQIASDAYDLLLRHYKDAE